MTLFSNINGEFLPGQALVLHILEVCDDPLQTSPPPDASWEMVLTPSWTPSPQLLVQDSHLQAPHLQSTEIMKLQKIISIMEFFPLVIRIARVCAFVMIFGPAILPSFVATGKCPPNTNSGVVEIQSA